jgi:hypothetical protein
MCYGLKLEACVVVCTTGSRGEEPGKKKPVVKDDDDKPLTDIKFLFKSRTSFVSNVTSAPLRRDAVYWPTSTLT